MTYQVTIDIPALEAIIADYPVTGCSGVPYLQSQLKAAFERVQDKADWKNPVDALVMVKDVDEEMMLIDAVIHFTGSVPTLTRIASENGVSLMNIKARGYYAACGA